MKTENKNVGLCERSQRLCVKKNGSTRAIGLEMRCEWAAFLQQGGCVIIKVLWVVVWNK